MGVGNLLGQPFYNYLNKQVEIRQEVYGSGFTGNNTNSNRRSAAYQQYLNSRTSWVKLASSVLVTDKSTVEVTGSEGQNSTYVDEGGLRFLNKLDLPNQYKGVNLSREAVLFSGLQGTGNIIPVQDQTVIVNGEETTVQNANAFTGNTNFIQRSGISKTTSVWNLTSAYGLGGLDFGQQPMPGITDVSITSLNRGSLKRAEVKIKANNRYQFELIETIYLRLGYTMLLEWGNSHYLPNEGGEIIKDPTTGVETKIPTIDTIKNTYTEDKWFSQNGKSTYEIMADLEKLRELYSGNYDAFFGKVVNFNWSFNNDGTYDIDISLISMGDIVESLKFNSLYHPKDGIPVNEEDDISDIVNHLNSVKLNTQLISQKYGPYKCLIDPNITFRKIDDDTEENQRKSYEFTNRVNSQQNKYGYYWRFGDFLGWVQKHLIPTYTSGNEEFKQIRIDADEVNNVMCAYPNQFSVDPRVCIVKTNYGKNLNLVKNPDWYDGMLDWVSEGPTYENIKVVPHGRIMNIYINFNEIITIVNSNKNRKGDIDFYSFFSKLLENINKALGGVNNLEFIVEEDSNTIKIIDQNIIPGSAVNKQNGINFYNNFIKSKRIADKSTKIEMFGYDQRSGSYTSNFVKDFKFETKIDKNLANTLSISAAAGGGFVGEDATAFSSWSKGLIDKYKQHVNIPEEDIGISGSGVGENVYYKTNVYRYYEEGGYEYKPIRQVATQRFDDSGNIVTNEAYNEDRVGVEIEYGSLRAGTRGKKTIQAYTGTEYYITQAGHDKVATIVNNVYNRDIGYFITECFGSDVTGKGIPQVIANDDAQKISVLSNTSQGQPLPTTNTLIQDGGRYLEFNPQVINRGQSAMKNYLLSMGKHHYKQTGKPTGTGGFIPLDLSITLDGISGVKIYNSINVDTSFLPSTYGDDLDFIVRGVNHKLSDGDWSTDIDCLSIPRPTEKIYEQEGDTPIPLTSSIVNNEYSLPAQILTPINGYRQGENLYVIRMDADGSGLFGARRSNGTRQHKGLDFLVQKDRTIRAPFGGKVTLTGPSLDTPNLKGIKIKGDERDYIDSAYKGYECKMFYFLPNDNITNGMYVDIGDELGKAQEIVGEGKYNPVSNQSMQNHIHFELYYNGELVTLQSSVENAGTGVNNGGSSNDHLWLHNIEEFSPGYKARPFGADAIFEVQTGEVGTVSSKLDELKVKEKWISEWRKIRKELVSKVLDGVTGVNSSEPRTEAGKTFTFILFVIDEFISAAFGSVPPQTPIEDVYNKVIQNTKRTQTDLDNTRFLEDNSGQQVQRIKNYFIEQYLLIEGIDDDYDEGGVEPLFIVGGDPMGYGSPWKSFKRSDYDEAIMEYGYEVGIQTILFTIWDNYGTSDPTVENKIEEYYQSRPWVAKIFYQGDVDL